MTEPAAGLQLVGIRGWLIVPAIGVGLGPIVLGALFLVGLSMYSQVAAAGYGRSYAFLLLVDLGILILGAYTATRFFGKKRNAPFMVIELLSAYILAASLRLVVTLGAGNPDGVAIECVRDLVRSVIGAAILVPYFRVSKRVKATFVR